MKNLSVTLSILTISLVLVLQISCVPISDYTEAIDYLRFFEYLTHDEKTSLKESVSKHDSIDNDRRFKRALENLQKNGNIPITGKVDKATVTLMKTPRCGVSDKNLLNVKRHKRYTLMSSKWSKTDLTWSYNPKENDPFVKESANIRRIIGEALKVWEQDTIMTFKEIPYNSAQEADILVSFEAPKHYDVDPYPFGPSTLAHAFQPGNGVAGDAHFNREVKWDFDVSYDSKPREGKVSFFAVALHELGHSLGLGHTRDTDAVMYEFYSRSTATLAEDDIRGMQHIYGVPPGKKFNRTIIKVPESEEQMPIWGTAEPNKCNTSYDAIAMIDNSLWAFKGTYMFDSSKTLEIRSRFKELPQKIQRVDAVYQTADGKVLIFIDTDIYIFSKNKLDAKITLQSLGLDDDIKKVDAVFRWSKDKQTYVFSDASYWILDEKTLKLKKTDPARIDRRFRDVYDIDTAFTYKDDNLYFFINEHYFEFDNKYMKIRRMEPKLSGNLFMGCEIKPDIEIVNRFSDVDNDGRDYIDLGPHDEELIEEEEDTTTTTKKPPKKPSDNEKDNANSIQSAIYVYVVLFLSYFIF